MPSRFAAVVAALCAAPAFAQLPSDPPYYRVAYPPSAETGELAYGVTYTAWVPLGAKTLRGVIVHQHGCGVGACKGGETAAYDLHWKEGRFARIWETTVPFVRDLRAKNAPVCLAVDPRTSHECGDSRYLAVPYLDACLKLRLPDRPGGTLKPISVAGGVLALDDTGWLPNEAVAKLWAEYVKTGATTDTTPPPAPTGVRVAGNVLTWVADADFESGLAGFVIERDGQELARLPEKPVGKFGRPLFQPMSYHDTPEQPLPAMRYEDKSARPGESHDYRVLAVNGVGLRSPAVRATRPR